MAGYHRVIGIDLGTTYSVVAAYNFDKQDVLVIPNRQNERTTPSVVYVSPKKEVSVGKAAKDFKANFDAKNAAAIEKDAATAAAAYEAMSAFWKARKAAHATEWSDASAKAATATAAAAKAGDWNKVKTEWGIVGANCKKCHEAHREKLDDGSYKIK